jgi:hypothetical protein
VLKSIYSQSIKTDNILPITLFQFLHLRHNSIPQINLLRTNHSRFLIIIFPTKIALLRISVFFILPIRKVLCRLKWKITPLNSLRKDQIRHRHELTRKRNKAKSSFYHFFFLRHYHGRSVFLYYLLRAFPLSLLFFQYICQVRKQ